MSKHINAQLGLAYLEDRLDAARRAKLERHLADCPACQAELRQHQAMHGLLQSAGQALQLQPETAPSWPAVRGRYQKQERAFRAGLRLAAAALVALVAVAAVLLATRRPAVVEPAASPVPPTAEVSPAPGVTPTYIPVETATRLPSTFLPTATGRPGGNPSAATAAAPAATTAPRRGGAILALFVSVQGQLAFIQDRTLLVETAAGFGQFAEVALYLYPTITGADTPVANDPVAWSPDGNQLAFFYARSAEPGAPYQLGIWDSRTGRLSNLAQLANRALPAVPFTSYHWSPDSTRLLLTTSDRLDPERPWTSGIWAVNLTNGELTLVVEANGLAGVTWLGNETFLMELRCGLNCATLIAYNEQRWQQWKLYEEDDETLGAAAYYSLYPDQGLLVNPNIWGPARTLDLVDIITGEVTPVWTLPSGARFAGLKPHLSPDGRTVAFNTITGTDPEVRAVQVIGLDGQDYGRRENSQVLDWRPGGGPVVVQSLAGGQNQLIYWPVAGTAAARVFVRPRDFTFLDGKWSPDGQWFVYNALDSSIGASYLYLWQPESGNVPFLIHSAASQEAFTNFTWLPDGQALVFTLGASQLLRYDLATGALQLLAAAE
ncbi:MAG: zf-HC2 domain-containing protein [Chloroflexi bacterium]|nr:zf-HC2 domain-containing protein [Chloroflexota bacterium]MCI0575824.1 zf-HC2 domain-containing protein [Chloroflexota bacterium]MCI0646551.1 zf-HC2 domain-containing protein [Chloroflexota bacterium]MCI0726353.1 zf-HC2 domain-containing protein [Chloroflexota bacterium]